MIKKLKNEQITIVIDNREQKPFEFKDIKTQSGALNTGDYSILGFEKEIALERKSLPDLISCITSNRERFERELLRLRSYSRKMVIIEAGWIDIINHNYKSKVNPKSVTHSIISWTNKYGIPFLFAGNRLEAQKAAEYFLYSAANQFYEVTQRFNFKSA